MAVEEECGAQDEIKEFKHEGELDSHTDALLDIKNALVRAADKPPLIAALDYLSQIKESAGISPVVIEVANRIKHEQFLKNRSYQASKHNSHPYYSPSSNPITTPASSSKTVPTQLTTSGLDSGRRSVSAPYIPNVNAANFQQPFPQPTWSTSSPASAAAVMANFSPQQRQMYYNMPPFAQPTPFGQTSGTQLLTQQASSSTPSETPTTTTKKTSKAKKKSTHIKKPLNAFMLYMKEMRAKVVQEYTLKESAAINQILGKRWHALDRSEQQRFYEMARRERQLHMQMYPNWSARSNYASGGKKKRKRDKTTEQDAGSPKKCRARYGLDKQSSWCKPCRRKKKCVRYMQGELDHQCCDNNEHHKPSCPAAGAGTHEPGCPRGTTGEGGSCDCNTHTCGKEDRDNCNCKEDFQQLANLSLAGRDQAEVERKRVEGNVFQGGGGGGFYPTAHFGGPTPGGGVLGFPHM